MIDSIAERSHRTVLTPSNTDAWLRECRNTARGEGAHGSITPFSLPQPTPRCPPLWSRKHTSYRRAASTFLTRGNKSLRKSCDTPGCRARTARSTISRFVSRLVRFPVGQSGQLAPALRRAAPPCHCGLLSLHRGALFLHDTRAH